MPDTSSLRRELPVTVMKDCRRAGLRKKIRTSESEITSKMSTGQSRDVKSQLDETVWSSQ